jgi:hypothetical protein
MLEGKTKEKIQERLMVALTIGILLVSLFVVLFSSNSTRAEDYTFGSENAVKGTTQNPTYKNTEDGSYESLVEGDQYPDTNFSGSSENVVAGTAGGSAFPSALDTDDSNRRSYTEANTGSSPTYRILRPSSDGSPLTMVPTPTGTHYTCLDETTAGGNGDTDYIEGVTNAQEDTYGMSDATDPGGTYNIDVLMWTIHDDEGAVSNLQTGLDIGGTNYLGWQGDGTSGVYANSTYTWTLNPSTSAEWTLTQVNALNTYQVVTDANPDTRTTQIALLITFTPTANYVLDVQITYSSVTSTSQTISYKVFCQGYRSSTENFKVQAWDYVSLGWNDKTTIQAASDTDYNFDLTANERDGSANEVKLRIVDASGDAVQDIVYFDVLKVSRIEKGFALEVEMTASSTNQYGEQRLRIKGYTSAETFYVDIYNWTASLWDAQVITVTEFSNTWHTYELSEANQRSGTQQIKIRFMDGTASSSDTAQDTLFLDVAWVTWIHTNPILTEDGGDSVVNEGAAANFWLKYTDTDNEAPTYVRITLAGVDYDMTANNSGDLLYTDGKAYKYSTSSLARGVNDYFFKAKDANSVEITTATKQITVNGIPVLSHDCVAPTTGSNGDTFSYHILYTDLDNNAPSYIRVTIDSNPYDMTANYSGDLNYADGKDYHYEKAMSGGSHTFFFSTKDYNSAEVTTTTKNLNVNNAPTLTGFSRYPADPVYPTTQLLFNVTFTDLDGDLPSSIKWRESQGSIQNVTMAEVDPGDTNTVDGKLFSASIYLSHGSHEYDFYAADVLKGVSGGSGTVSIENRAPTITTTPSGTTVYRNTYWEYDADASDPDSDSIAWQMSTNASFLSINPSSGLISGTTSNSVGFYSVTYWANDSYAGSDSDFFSLEVMNRNPSISSSGNTTQLYGTYMAYAIVATDPDGDSLNYALSTEAPFLSISGQYVNGTANQFGSFDCTIWANDTFGGSDSDSWILAVSNEAPYFTSTPVYWVQNHSAYSYDANGTDPEGLTLTYDLAGNCTSFLSIDGVSGVVSGIASKVGSYNVEISVTDGTNWAWQNFSLGVNNTKPTISTSAITTGTVGIQYYYDANASDLNDDALNWELTEKPGWLFVDSATGELQGTPTGSGAFLIKLNVFDGYEHDYQDFTLTIESGSEPPEPPIPPTPPASGDQGSSLLVAEFSFNHDSPTVKFYANILHQSEIASVLWDFGDGTQSTAFPTTTHYYSHQGFYIVTLTVVDENGLSDSVSKTIRIYLNAKDPIGISGDSIDIYIGWGNIISFNTTILSFLSILGFSILGITFIFRSIRPTRKFGLRIVGILLMGNVLGLLLILLTRFS